MKRDQSSPTAVRKKPAKPAAPAKRTRRSADDLLAKIVRAAAEEFRRNGYSGATTAAIARRAEVTEAQLFRYFESKSNLFRETVFKPLDQHFMDFVSKHTAELGRADGRKEITPIYTSELQRFIASHSQLLMSLIVAQTYDPEASRGMGKIDPLTTYFEHGAAIMEKRLKRKPRIDPQIMVRLAFASVLGSVMFRDWLFPSGIASDRELEDAVNIFVMEGISANREA